MKFDIDDRSDVLTKLKAQYHSSHIPDDKKLILKTINFVKSEEAKHMFTNNGRECSW
jgi:hypothetical protein